MKVDKFKPRNNSLTAISSYRLAVTILAFLFALSLSACDPWTRGGQTARTDFINLHPGESLGQTFTARYRGLAGIEIFLKPGDNAKGNLSLKLYPGSQDPQVIALASLNIEELQIPAYYPLKFKPQPSSNNHDYFFSLDFDGEGTIQIGTAPGSSYLDGALYHNAQPLNLQTNFLLVYNPIQAVIGLILMALTWVWYLLISVFLFVIPGWAFLSMLWRRNQSMHWTEKAALSVGLSLAIYPVLYLWINLVGLRLGYLYAWLPPSLALIWFLWKASATFRTKGFSLSHNTIKSSWGKKPDWGKLARFLPSLSLLIVLGLVFSVRFWVVRTLDVPMWGDSYQHTMIAQLLVNNHGLFSSWEPYAEIQTFTYHFGFHSLVAVFHYITHLPMPQATLLIGQILNGLAVFALYPLATRLGGNRLAGVVAVLIAGLLVPMPMYYVNWGRYTQLAGLTILPIAVFFLWRAIESKTREWGLIILSWIAMAGLALTHYRVLIFAVIFIIALYLVSARRKNLVTFLTNTILVGFGAGLLFMPWFLRVFSGRIIQIFGSQISTPASIVSDWTQGFGTIGNLFFFLPVWIWLLLPVILGWGLWLRKHDVAITALWWLLIFWAANPSWLGLPGDGALSNFAVSISYYMFGGIILGSGFGWVFNLYNSNLGNHHVHLLTYTILGTLLVLGIGLWGVRERISDIQIHQHTLVTRPDLRAFAWIEDNVSNNARFLVNSFPAYNNYAIVGSDAGWWLPLLSSRQTTLYPLNINFEEQNTYEYRQWMTALIVNIQEYGFDHPDVLDLLIEEGITHIFIGQQDGSVNSPNAYRLDAQRLINSTGWHQVYHHDRVWIFALNYQR